MPAALRLIASDGTTVVSSVNEGTVVGSWGGTLYYLENYGDQSWTAGTLALAAIGSNDGIGMGSFAPDVSGAPGSYQTAPLTVPTLAPLARYGFWLKTVVPGGTTSDANPRRFNLFATGTST